MREDGLGALRRQLVDQPPELAGPDAKGYSSPQAAAAESTAGAAGLLFLSSAGVISAATLAIGVLTAVGPVFIVLALIPATRGLFVGWVRAMAAAAMTPLPVRPPSSSGRGSPGDGRWSAGRWSG